MEEKAEWRSTFGAVVYQTINMEKFEEIREFGGLYDMFHLEISWY